MELLKKVILIAFGFDKGKKAGVENNMNTCITKLGLSIGNKCPIEIPIFQHFPRKN